MKFTKDVLRPPHTAGRYSYGAPAIIGSGAVVKIGSFCSISEHVKILLDVEHIWSYMTTYPFSAKEFAIFWPETNGVPACRQAKGDVTIGSDVWLGYNALILSGVVIGHGAIVGANAVVTREVVPYAVVAGNPARCVRYRFDEETIRQLLHIRWWDWPEEKLREWLRRSDWHSAEKLISFHVQNKDR